MNNEVTPGLAQSSAVQAFEELRGEVSLLRRAVGALAAERREQPDYGPTLEALAASTDAIGRWAAKIDQRPALQLTPERIGEQIEAAASYSREKDERLLSAAHEQLQSAMAEVKALSRLARTSQEQARREKIVGGICFLGGLMLGTLLAQIAALSI